MVRRIIERILSPQAVKILRERFRARAETLVAKLVGVGSFAAMEELARVFPVEAFADEVGVSEEGRENLLPYGDMVFNGQGPRNEYFRTAMQNAAEVQEWLMASCRRESLPPAASATRSTKPPTPARSPKRRPGCSSGRSSLQASTPP